MVAGEVRSLARRSAGASIGETLAAIQRVSVIMGQTSTASSAQSSGVAQAGQALVAMDRATQQNAAPVEQSAAAAESLRRQAAQLVQAVSGFRLALEQ